MFRSRQAEVEKDPRYRDFVRSLRESLFGTQGAPPDPDFGAIEDMAHQIGRAVAREFCEQAAAQQARGAEQPHPCPDCQRESQGTVTTRELMTRDGPIELPEAEHFCPHCRRAFFPRPTESAAESSPVQPPGRGRARHGRRRRPVV